VSTGAEAAIERTGDTGATGALIVASGGKIAANGSIALDSSQRTVLDGELDLTGALYLGSHEVTLGIADVPSGVGVSAAQIESLGLTGLTLASRTTIHFAADLELDISGRLALDAQALVAEDGINAVLRADSIVLRGSDAAVAPPTGLPATAHLTLYANDDFSLAGGQLAGSGWSDVALGSGGSMHADADGGLQVTGSLGLTAAHITGAAGIDYEYQADGALRIASVTGPTALGASAAPTAGDATPALGAALRFVGSSIGDQGSIRLPAGMATFVATAGDVVMQSSAQLDLAGVPVVFDGVTVAAPGGTARFEAQHGNVLLGQGTLVDVAGAAGGQGGRLELSAANGRVDIGGQIRGGDDPNGMGSAIDVDAAAVAGLDALATQARSNGFTAEFVLRERGPGDLQLAAGNTLAASDVQITADQGSIWINGTIDTRNDPHSRVVLSARDTVGLTGAIEAGSDNGGDVELRAQNGVLLDPLAVVDVGGPNGTALGSFRARVSLTALASPASVTLLGAIDGAAQESLEVFASFDDADGVLGAADVLASTTNPLYAAAANIAAQSNAILAQVGRAADPNFVIVPGLEIRSSQGLTLSADWNLATWRFGNVAGVLTLRAAGDLRFNQTLSDGFSGVTGTARFTQLTSGPSWSYRLAAGADLGSADPLAVLPTASLAGQVGSLYVAPGVIGPATGTSDFRMIRTGAGSIEIATARDLVLGNRASTIYTAGLATDGTRLTGLSRLPYPDGGGDVTIEAQGDVIGAATNQMITDWLWRAGRPADAVSPTPTAWTVAFQRFEQNIGTLGGGNLTIEAGGDIENLSAVVPSVGRQRGTATSPQLDVVAGGDLLVRAGGDIDDGTFFVGKGTGLIEAGGSIRPVNGSGVVLALADAQVEAHARRDVAIETVVNPTLLPQGIGQRVSVTTLSNFSTYSPDASVTLGSTGGDVSLSNNFVATGWLRQQLTSINFTEESAFALGVYAPSLRAVALSGDVDVGRDFSLFPAPKGNLELFARDSLNLQSDLPVIVLVSDSDPNLLPNVVRPDTQTGWLLRAFQPTTNDPLLHAAVPVHSLAAQPDGFADSTPLRLVALDGDVLFQSERADGSVLYAPKPVHVVAGRDIVGLSMIVQHDDPGGISTLVAGRDIIYPTQRASNGALGVTARGINVGGGGHFELLAGRDVDLGSSTGIATTGNLLNAALPATGAAVDVVAGLGAQGLHIADFVTAYLENSDEYAGELAAYLEGLPGIGQAGGETPVAVFRGLPMDQQLPFVEQVFLEELKASGRSAAQAGPTHDDFSRGFKAIETLFPGANPDLDAGATNPYAGDVRLFFSKIYTLQGGDISILAPGGLINAGLSTPPAAFGITKPASELGIVAQREGDVDIFGFSDLLVNESRVFAADGGNILVWSTRGDIDAGRGSKTAISAPPPVITIDDKGNLQAQFPAALTGSGIQTLATSEGRKPGDVDLFAPHGVVNAGDAGIVAGNLTIGATAVLGADNISVSGVAVGVPVDTGGFAAALTGVSAVAASAANTAEQAVTPSRQQTESQTPLAEQALGFLDVFVTGFGEECDPKKETCDKDKDKDKDKQ
jgi:hypothetical protein